MSRLALPVLLLAWAGVVLLLDELPWFRRVPLAERLRRYAPGAGAPGTVPASATPQQVLGPLAQHLGTRLARVFGVQEELAVRLRRIHAGRTVGELRTRQLGWSAAAFGAAALGGAALRLPPALLLAALVGAPLLAFLLVEQQVASTSAAWQRRTFLELPVVAEQLGMLLSAGYSLGAALHRLAQRGDGACARDLRRVVGRVQQGLSEVDALREWAALVQVDAVDRLVAVLALNREAGDLGHLITEEARAMRGDAHRELLATIERRAQQVWIPVTVATLLPGVLFLAVPFVDALQLFTGG